MARPKDAPKTRIKNLYVSTHLPKIGNRAIYHDTICASAYFFSGEDISLLNQINNHKSWVESMRDGYTKNSRHVTRTIIPMTDVNTVLPSGIFDETWKTEIPHEN